MEIPESEADWRCSKVFRVNGDQVAWGQLFKDGTLGWLTTQTKDSVLGNLSFPTPSPAALAFSLAFESARAASALRSQISFQGTSRGPKSIEIAAVPTLFALFEQSMSSVVFSFQCLEAFANETMARLVTQPIDVSRRSGVARLTPEELERKLSTEEKLLHVLPNATSVQSPKGTALWGRYRELKDVRDSTVHLKSGDQYVRNKIDKESVYYRLLKRRPYWYAQTTVSLVKHFSGATPPRWLEAAQSRLKAVQQANGRNG